MGVKVRKKGAKWWVFVDWRGNRKAKCVGSSREAAEKVRHEIEKRLALTRRLRCLTSRSMPNAGWRLMFERI
jgi:hypothetical protein